MKPCFGYMRVSTLKQGEGVSLEAQKDAITAFASRHDLSIIQWFEEKETAAKSGRPVFSQMLKQLERGRASGLVIHKIDRSARNLKDWAMISELSDRGIGVYFATESLDFRSRGGRLTADIQAVIAADYIRNLSEEARKGIDGRLKQGIFPWPAPPGYRDEGRGKAKSIHPIQGPLVRRLFDLYLSGNHSIYTLHLEMARQGLTNKRGGRLCRHTVELILSNPFYCGFLRNGRTGETFKGIHKPLLAVREYERVQEIKAGRSTKRVTRHNHLFRRLLTCDICHSFLTGELQKGHCYYRCHTRGCVRRALKEEIADRGIRQCLVELSMTISAEKEAEATIASWDFAEQSRAKLASIDLRFTETKARILRLTELLIDGAIDTATHHERKVAFEMQLVALQEERAKLAENADNEDSRRNFFELLKTVAELYDSATNDEKRELIETTTSNRTWDGEKLRVQPLNSADTVDFS